MTDDAQTSNDPRLNYTGRTEAAANADYAGMPGGAQILLVDKTSGNALDGGVILYSGGSGSVEVTIDDSTPSGAYYLTALDAAGEELTQTVEFYISRDLGGGDSE